MIRASRLFRSAALSLQKFAKLALIVAAYFIVIPAANARTASFQCWVYVDYVGKELSVRSTDIFDIDIGEDENIDDLVDKIEIQFSKFVNQDTKYTTCYHRENFKSRIAADNILYIVIETLNWRPQITSEYNGEVQSTFLRFSAPGREDSEGFSNASIRLKYRFLICAGEVQVAYGIDRSTFDNGERYRIYPQSGGYRDVKGRTVSAPMAIDLRAVVYWTVESNVVANFKDGTAGESLGLGCFTGQTHSLGKAKDLIPANFQKTPVEQRFWLSKLVLASQFGMIPTVLKSSGTGTGDMTPDNEAAGNADRKRNADSELAILERAAVEALNAKNLEKTLAAGRAIQAQKDEYARNRANYDREMAAVRSANIKFEADKAANDAAVAEYQAKRSAYEAEMKAKGLVPQ